MKYILCPMHKLLIKFDDKTVLRRLLQDKTWLGVVMTPLTFFKYTNEVIQLPGNRFFVFFLGGGETKTKKTAL